MFERRLIEKYIAENGTDPISGEPVSEEQLIDIKGRIIINWHIPFKQNCLIKTWKQILLWLGSSYHSVTSQLHLLFPYWMHLFLSLDTIMLFFLHICISYTTFLKSPVNMKRLTFTQSLYYTEKRLGLILQVV